MAQRKRNRTRKRRMKKRILSRNKRRISTTRNKSRRTKRVKRRVSRKTQRGGRIYKYYGMYYKQNQNDLTNYVVNYVHTKSSFEKDKKDTIVVTNIDALSKYVIKNEDQISKIKVLLKDKFEDKYKTLIDNHKKPATSSSLGSMKYDKPSLFEALNEEYGVDIFFFGVTIDKINRDSSIDINMRNFFGEINLDEHYELHEDVYLQNCIDIYPSIKDRIIDDDKVFNTRIVTKDTYKKFFESYLISNLTDKNVIVTRKNKIGSDDLIIYSKDEKGNLSRTSQSTKKDNTTIISISGDYLKELTKTNKIYYLIKKKTVKNCKDVVSKNFN